MSDNTLLNPGAGGDTITTEDIGGVKMPRSKIALGAAGVDGGDVTLTNPFPVQLSDGTNTFGVAARPVRTDPTGTTPQPITSTALTQLAAAAGLAGDATSAMRQLLMGARDVDNSNVLAGLTVDGSGRLIITAPGGLSVSGSSVTATTTGAATIATETTLGAFKTSFEARQPVVGQAAMAASMPVVLASNQSAIPITDNSGSLTIDSGQFPAALAAGGGFKVEGVVGGVAQPVSLATLPALATGSNTIGKVDQGTGGASAWKVDGSAVTQPISATALTQLGAATGLESDATASMRRVLVGALDEDDANILTALRTNGFGWLRVTLDTDTVDVGSTTLLTTAAFQARTPAYGQATMANSSPVVLSSNHSNIPVSLQTALVTGTATIGAVTAPGAAALALDATLTGGTQKAINRGGAKGSTTAADITSTSIDTNHQGIDIADGGGSITVDGAVTVSGTATVTQGTAAAAGAPWSMELSDGSAFYTAAKTGQLPTALAAGGGLKIEGVASGVNVPVLQGTAAAAGAPWSVELSDGSAFYTGAKTGQLPTSLGQQTAASSLSVVPAKTSVTAFSSLATAGVLIKSGAGVVYFLQLINNTGGTISPMLFDATSTQSNGAVPLHVCVATTTGAFNNHNIGATNVGVPFTNGLWLQNSSSIPTMTSIASTACTGHVEYD